MWEGNPGNFSVSIYVQFFNIFLFQEEFYGKKLIIADRNLVEQGADEILSEAAVKDIALLVVGDPFGATTHTDLILRAKEKQIPFQIVHNASILNAVGCCGLQLYSFGETVSIPYWTDSWQPDSFYDKIKANIDHGLHTLCLLDIRVKEPTLESLMKKTQIFQPARFMSVSEAAEQLLRILEKKRVNETTTGILHGYLHISSINIFMFNLFTAYTESTLCVGLARIGHETQEIKVCTLNEMCRTDLGSPLHSLIIVSNNIHPIEKEYLQQFSTEIL